MLHFTHADEIVLGITPKGHKGNKMTEPTYNAKTQGPRPPFLGANMHNDKYLVTTMAIIALVIVAFDVFIWRP
jgi:hypothetical protein